MNEKDYTFILSEKSKIRYNAGSYNDKTKTPEYKIDVLTIKDLKNQIVISQFLMGKEDSYIWVWDLENKSTWPAFVSIMRDGILVKDVL